MTSPSTPSSSTTTSASTAASTTAPASTTTSGPATISSDHFTREDFISQQQAVLCENADHLAYYDYVAIRVSQIFEELDPSDPDAQLIGTLWLPYTEDLEQLRHLQAVHREAFKPYFAGEYDSDAEESALRTRILETVVDFKTFQVFYRNQMESLLELVTKMDLIDQDRLVGSTKIKYKKSKRAPSGGSGGLSCKFGCFLSLGILVMMVICYWYYSGSDSTAKGGSSSKEDGTTTHALWITITKAVDGPGGYGTEEPTYGSKEPTYGPKDSTFAPDDLTYGPNNPSNGPYGPRPVPKERSLLYEEDPPAPLHRPNKDSGSHTVGLTGSILIALLVTVPVVILGIVAYYRFAVVTTSGDGAATTSRGGGQKSQDLESGYKNTESRETQESEEDLES